MSLGQRSDSLWPPRQLARQVLCLVVAINCCGAMCWMQRLVVAAFKCPSCAWITLIGTFSAASSAACVWRRRQARGASS